MMTLREQLLHVSTLYAETTKTRGRQGQTTLAGISTRIFKDGKTLRRIADGGDVTTGNFEKALLWFSDNWPEGLEWPHGVARPAPSSEAA